MQERNHQISLMRCIYSNARQIVSWLGETDADSDLAMDYHSSDA